MFGIANQLLACVALCVGTTVIMNGGRARYAWVTLLPLAFVATTTLTAGWLAATQKFLPMANFQGHLCAGLLFTMMGCVLLILGESVLRWYRIATGRIAVPRAA